MWNVNTVVRIGNATRDAELRHTQKGNAVSGIHLAKIWTVKGGEETNFHITGPDPP